MKLKTLKVSDIKIKFNHREIGDISGLMTSIKTEGLLIPISVLKEGSSYYLVDGHRRLSAIKKLKLDKVDALITTDEVADKEMLMKQATHNEARKSLSVFERYLLYKKLLDEGYSIEEISAHLDVDPRQVKEVSQLGRHLPLTKLKDVVYGRHGIPANKGKVSLGNAKRIAVVSKSGKLNGKKLDKVWEDLKKGKRVESINIKNEMINIAVRVTVPAKYRDKFQSGIACGKAINTYLATHLFKDYV